MCLTKKLDKKKNIVNSFQIRDVFPFEINF